MFKDIARLLLVLLPLTPPPPPSSLSLVEQLIFKAMQQSHSWSHSSEVAPENVLNTVGI